MQNSNSLRRVSLLAFALLIALVAGAMFVAIASSATRTPTQSRLTDAAAQDMEMVMQELEREQLDQPNSVPPSTHTPNIPIFYDGAVHGQADPVME